MRTIRDHLGEMVLGAVEETLNALLDAEADELCGAGRYQRSAERVDTRAGSYDRMLQTKAGEVKLKVSKLRQQVFETAIIERYRRREIRRRTRVVGAFADGQSCLNLAAARLRHIAGTQWSTKRYMNMRPLYQAEQTETEVNVA